jgi:hypothetical protein
MNLEADAKDLCITIHLLGHATDKAIEFLTRGALVPGPSQWDRRIVNEQTTPRF